MIELFIVTTENKKINTELLSNTQIFKEIGGLVSRRWKQFST
jgi:hypothetical protein